MTPTWFPAPLTPADLAAAVVASDVAGQVEAAKLTFSIATGPPIAWDDSYLTEDDRRAWRP